MNILISSAKIQGKNNTSAMQIIPEKWGGGNTSQLIV